MSAHTSHSEDTSPPGDLLSDTPLEHPSRDLLGRSRFAEVIAQSIAGLAGTDSFVFAVCGPWGCGKSTLINFVLHHLSEKQKPGVPFLVVKFNPWWFSGSEQVLNAFLGQMSAALGRHDQKGRLPQLAKRIRLLAKILQPLRLVPGVPPVVGDLAAGLHSSAGTVEAIGEIHDQDVTTLRCEIDTALTTLDHRVLVVVDDIDRLTATQVAQVFLVIRSVADFPNTVYLIGLDPEVVSETLTKEYGVDGSAFLEKIIQMPFSVPMPTGTLIQSLFLRHIESMMHDCEFKGQKYVDFGNIFHDGVKPLLKTPRAAKRIINHLRVAYAALRGEVYVPDLIGIIALEAILPTAVGFVRDNAAHFVGSVGDSEDPAAGKVFCDKWLEEYDQETRSILEATLARLFPRFEAMQGGNRHGGDWEGGWRSDMRVCSEAHFDKYFMLGPQAGTINEADWRGIIERVSDAEAFDRHVLMVCKETGSEPGLTKAMEFLERAQNHGRHKASPETASALFQSLCRLGDDLIAQEDEQFIYLLSIQNELRMQWALQSTLEASGTQQERDALVLSTFHSSMSFATLVGFYKALGYQHNLWGVHSQSAGDKETLVSGKAHTASGELLLSRIEEFARSGALAEHSLWKSIWDGWVLLGAQAPAQKWLESLYATDRGLAKIVRAATSRPRQAMMGDRVATSALAVDVKSLADVFDLDECKERAKRIVDEEPDWLTADLRIPLEALLK